MIIYLAGPMTGRPQLNYPEFFRVAGELRALGHEVINPAETNGSTLEQALEDLKYNPMTWQDYLKVDIANLAKADAICMLPDWWPSKGATLEHHIAKVLEMPIYIFQDGQLKPRVEVLGISGYARSGKDTIAEHLADKGYVRASFADNIRKALYLLNPMVEVTGEVHNTPDGVYLTYYEPLKNLVDNHGWEAAKREPDVRRLLQVFGTEVGRSMFGVDVWVNLLFHWLEDGSKIVIPDVRYFNEVLAIKRLGGKVWRVERPGVTAVNAHVSEKDLDDYKEFDQVINNNDTVDSLHKVVDTILFGVPNE